MKICGPNLHLLHLLSIPQSLWLPKGKEGWNFQLHPLNSFITFSDDLHLSHVWSLLPNMYKLCNALKTHIYSSLEITVQITNLLMCIKLIY